MAKSHAATGESSIRSSKGFLFEADDTTRPALCRDVRGFPAALELAKESATGSLGRLVLIVPDLAMDDWLARWADDVVRPRRDICITRRTDQRQLRLTASLLSYGYGVDTTIQVEALVLAAKPSKATEIDTDAPPQSGFRELDPVGLRASGVTRPRLAR